MSKGLLIVVSAPSGCGKGTILAQVLKNDNFYYSVSATTRSPREGEVDGVNYHFLTKEGFGKLIAEDGMLEHACYCGNYYGTPRKAVFDKLEEGKDVILEIEVQRYEDQGKMPRCCVRVHSPSIVGNPPPPP